MDPLLGIGGTGSNGVAYPARRRVPTGRAAGGPFEG